MTCLCSFEFILETISRKWTMEIIEKIGYHKKIRYNVLQSKLGSISPSILSSVLKSLENIGLISRKAHNEIPPKVEYSLTEKGIEFCELVHPLIIWASKDEKMNQNCKYLQKGYFKNITELKNRSFKKLIEVVMCADCGCIPEECKNSSSAKECPNCTLHECCCWATIVNK